MSPESLISILLSIPFLILLVLIATGPLLFPAFWHRRYKIVATGIGVFMIIASIIRGDFISVEESALEYFSFISLIAALYVASGGIYIESDSRSTPLTNALLLFFGAVISNAIGTTGAAILLIRPFLRLNQYRMKPYLVVFFIFIVCNIGGLLTPIGDPPLFIGFLRGVPFEWTYNHLIVEWIVALVTLLIVFCLFDFLNKNGEVKNKTFTGEVRITGIGNFLWLTVIIGTVFLDPAKIKWLPSIHGHSFLRELLQITIGFLCYKGSNKKALENNRFHFEPIFEVAFLFFGIFMSMIPALKLLEDSVHFLRENTVLTPSFFYWGTGAASAFLDNAPSYLTFFTAAMSYFGLSIKDPAMVAAFAAHPDQMIFLKVISVAAVFFGATTYIGNGPNFMVKAIAEDLQVPMPSFFGYMIKYSLPILLPLLFLLWWLFLR